MRSALKFFVLSNLLFLNPHASVHAESFDKRDLIKEETQLENSVADKMDYRENEHILDLDHLSTCLFCAMITGGFTIVTFYGIRIMIRNSYGQGTNLYGNHVGAYP